MRRALIAVAVITLALTACEDAGDVADEPVEPPERTDELDETEVEDDAAPGPEPVPAEPDDAAVDVEPEAVDPDEMLAQQQFGMEFEGLWHFDGVTEVAVVLAPDADVEELADELGDVGGVEFAEVADEIEVEERGSLGVLQRPDGPTPTVLLLTAEDHESATQLMDLGEREGVQQVLAPTCEGLAGTARHGGVEEARSLLEEAGCDQPVIIDADVDESWVAAAAVEDDEICIGTATADAAMSTCTEDAADPGMPVVTAAGGFIVGFAPDDVATVEIDYAGETASTEAVTVTEDAARAYAVFLPGDDDAGDETTTTQAPDIGEVTWRFLDADGEVVDQG